MTFADTAAGHGQQLFEGRLTKRTRIPKFALEGSILPHTSYGRLKDLSRNFEEIYSEAFSLIQGLIEFEDNCKQFSPRKSKDFIRQYKPSCQVLKNCTAYLTSSSAANFCFSFVFRYGIICMLMMLKQRKNKNYPS